ncbi:MAG: hypothetical protein IKC38_01540 [Clostridia bacterium]|nr:hypothetical protein [Clostridia bacterium]
MTQKNNRLTSAYRRIYRRVYMVLSIVLCIFIIGTLLWTVSYLPPYGDTNTPTHNEVADRYVSQGLTETGATNIVAGMILDYRAFDTLGESFVLFTAFCSCLIILQGSEFVKQHRPDKYRTFDDNILRYTMYVIVPMVMLFGVYVLLNGHLSPGGGFSGGAILGAGLVLMSLAFGHNTVSRFLTPHRIRVITCCSLCFYCLAKSYSFFTGANGLHSIIGPGVAGNILSGGLILPLNIAVGCVVACTMYSFYCLFERGDLK